ERAWNEIGHSSIETGHRTARHQCQEPDRRSRNCGLACRWGAWMIPPPMKGCPCNCCDGSAAAMMDQPHEIPQDLRNLVRVVSACTLGLWAFAVGLLIGVFLFL